VAKERKPLAALLIEAGKPKGAKADGDEGSDAEEEAEPGEERAAEDVIAAMKDGNAGDLVSALKDFGRICGWGKPKAYPKE